MATNLYLKLRDGEPVERLIKRFNRQVGKKKILERYKETLEYEKPSIKRRRRRLQQERQYKKA